MTEPTGPLAGLRVVELGGVGPGPYCGMILSDYGADVVKLDAPSLQGVDESWLERPLHRGRRRVGVDLKADDGRAVALALVDRADVVLEGYRPGVAERLGLGPDECLARNPKVVYGRMTGWGREGPYADRPGHDINFIAVSGVLHSTGSGPRPEVPLNLVGDFGGGGLLLALGVCAALTSAQRTGRGQVVDAAMLDGANLLMASVHGLLAGGQWSEDRTVNPPPGPASPAYGVYETADGGWMSVGCLEPKFFTRLLEVLGLADWFPGAGPDDVEQWPALRSALDTRFRTRTRTEWEAAFADADTCVAPVLSLREAMADAHVQARQLVVDVDGIPQAAPAPRFGATPAAVRGPWVPPGADTRAVLHDLGLAADHIDGMLRRGDVWSGPHPTED